MASSAVHPFDTDDGAPDAGALTPPVVDVLASSSSHVRPSVSDSDDGEPHPSEPSEGVVDDEVEEILELVEVEDSVALEQEILGDLENSRADSVELLGSVLDVEAESSSGSAVNGSERELPDDWVGVPQEDATLVSSSVVTHEFEYTPVKTTNLGSKRVYQLPRTEEEVLPAVGDVGSQLLAWPVGVAIEIISFQVKLIMYIFSISLWLCSFSFAAFTFPFRVSVKATNAAVATAVDGYTLATQIKPMVRESVAQAKPMLRRTTQKCGFGCLAAAYVMFMLGSLLVPALVVDFFLLRRIIEEPVEFRQVLHFDYRQEHPSATMSLLPPHLLAKAKDNVYPDKVLRARAIPPSHKLQVTIFFTLPESHYNLELGMFQVSAELLSVRGQVLKRASWPCMLRFQSTSVRYAKQVILGVPLLMGISREAQMLSLRLFENEEEMKIPTAFVRFILEPKAGIPSGQGLPQVYSAEAQVVSVLSWTMDILRRWKWTFYVWSGLSLFMFEIMVVLCCCHQVLLPSKLLQGIKEGFGEPEVVITKKSVKPGRRVNFTDELPTARPIREHLKPAEERELLLGSAEPTGPRQRRVASPSTGSEASSSSWSVPPLQTLDYVGGKVEEVKGSVKKLGDTVVDSAGSAMHNVQEVLDPKILKSD